MRTDYKFKSITRDGASTRCVIAFYEGDIALGYDTINGVETEVSRYRRSSELRTAEYLYEGTKTDAQLIVTLNAELLTDGERTPIDEQTT